MFFGISQNEWHWVLHIDIYIDIACECIVNPFFFFSKSVKPQVGKSNQFYFSIRIAKPQDIKSISEILTNSFHSREGIMSYVYPFLRLSIYEDLRHRIRSKGEHYLCIVAMVVKDTKSTENLSAIEGQDLVGTVEISVRSRQPNVVLSLQQNGLLSLNPWQLDDFEYAYLSNLAVDADYRRLGIAQQLLNFCELMVSEWGFCDLYLHVLENNHTARRLYYKAGYRLQEVEWTFGSLVFGQPRRLLLRKSFSD
ncbi:MAG: GNAT family N-acetyltransferase [Trichodesmium sp. MO_231.B1]|uniref:GNAT family N-acetyltransferase n=1 Tax=Okeania sp. SIO2F4 TaxID=2607790 RepID=UPI0025E2D755|nr:GNAT family N-acetyltransferase [Okeania sp. SIO2F4]MDJ0516012.1 GNAT family N-acetyltransferase [Trichodesmium sp. MO_231.B1]